MELVKFDQTVKIKKIWSAKRRQECRIPASSRLRPAGDGSRIYAASHDGSVTAFDPETGKQIWRNKLETELTAGPGVGEGRVVVASQGRLCHCARCCDRCGTMAREIEGESLARPLIKDDTVIVQTIDNRLEALSLFDGRKRWTLVQSRAGAHDARFRQPRSRGPDRYCRIRYGTYCCCRPRYRHDRVGVAAVSAEGTLRP